MRLLILALTSVLAVACAGDSEPPAETPPAPVEPPAATQPADPTDLLGSARLAKVLSPEWERVEEFTQQFYAGDLDKLYSSFSGTYKEEFSLQDLFDLHAKMRAEFGQELEVVATRTEENQGYKAFFRASRFSDDERLIEVAFVIGPDDTIAGLVVTPDRTAQPPAR